MNSILISIRAYKRLALKHSPQFLPNDRDAPAHWEQITKAYETLVNPDKRQYYDTHGNTPAGLEDFDLTTLEATSERAHTAEY
jgi:DnaJ-class molecular chaperone